MSNTHAKSRKNAPNHTKDHQYIRIFLKVKSNMKYPLENDELTHKHPVHHLFNPKVTIKESKVLENTFFCNRRTIVLFKKLKNNIELQNRFIVRNLSDLVLQQPNIDGICFYKLQKTELTDDVLNDEKIPKEVIQKQLYTQTPETIKSLNYVLEQQSDKIFRYVLEKPSMAQGVALIREKMMRLSLKELPPTPPDILQSTHFTGLYDNKSEKMRNKDEIQNDTNYSMIHTLLEPMEFIVYDRSHRLKLNVPIHCCTKIKLIFPADKSFMIIFNANLAHSGGPAIREDNVSSFNFIKSVRLFSYVTKALKHDVASTKSSNSRRQSISKQKQDGRVEQEYTFNCKDCNLCNSRILQNNNWNYCDSKSIGYTPLDVMECYEKTMHELKKQKQKESKKNYRSKQKQTEQHQVSLATCHEPKPKKKSCINQVNKD